MQYLLSLILISILLLCGRRFRVAFVLGVCVAVNLTFVLPYYIGAGGGAPANAPVLRAVSMNVNTENKRYDLVKQYVLARNPDILLLLEVDEAWLQAIADIEGLYPYKTSQPRSDNFGIALFSKRPCSKCEIIYLGEAGVPSVVGEFEVTGKRLTLLGTHPLPPGDGEYSRLRNRQFDAIAHYMAEVAGPRILLGDLNATPWSYKFGELVRQASLSDSARGFGLQFTWPTGSFLFRVPIDHGLVSSDIRVVHREVGGDVGSDHFPILIDFALIE